MSKYEKMCKAIRYAMRLVQTDIKDAQKNKDSEWENESREVNELLLDAVEFIKRAGDFLSWIDNK